MERTALANIAAEPAPTMAAWRDGSEDNLFMRLLRHIPRSDGVLCVFVAVALASCAQDTKPVRVENAKCGFSIVFPGKPHMSKSKVSTTGKDFIPVTRYSLETSGSLLAVSCSVARRKGQRKQLIDEARDAALRATGTRVVKEQQLGRVRSLEVEGDHVRGLVKLAFERDHYVQVLALSNSGRLSPAMHEFVASLRVK